MVESLSGAYRPLPDLIGATLQRDGHPDPDAALERFSAMPAFPDAAPALEHLREAGIRVGALSNSARSAAASALAGAGLELDLVVGSDSVEVFKPHPRLYGAGVEATGAGPGEVCLVAAHWWDVLGAARAGLRTAWVARTERVLMPGVEPDWTGSDLRSVAEAIVAG